MRCALLCCLILLAGRTAEEPTKQSADQAPPAAKTAVPPQPPGPAGAQRTEDLALQYSRARLQLAQTNLKRITSLNKRLDRTVPASTVAQYQRDVAEAELQVQHAAKLQAGYDFEIWLSRAEGEYQTAATRWKNALAGNARSKGTFEEIEVARFRLRAEVLRLLLERGRTVSQASPLAQLQWQMELLDLEIDQQQEESRSVTPFLRTYPLWW